MSDRSDKTTKLPVWLKIFSNSKPKAELDKESLQRIVKALQSEKSVIVLKEGKPVKLTRKGETVEVEAVIPKYVLE